jgi:hypothetical protein
MTFDGNHIRKMRKLLIQTKPLEELRDKTTQLIYKRLCHKFRNPSERLDQVTKAMNKRVLMNSRRNILKSLTTVILERRLLPILAKSPQPVSLSADSQSALMRYKTYMGALKVVTDRVNNKITGLQRGKRRLSLLLARDIVRPDPVHTAIKRRIRARVLDIGWREFMVTECTNYVRSTNVAKVKTLVKQFQKYNQIKRVSMQIVIAAAASQKNLQYLLGSDNGLLPRNLYVIPRSVTESQKALLAKINRPITPRPIVTKSSLMKLVLRKFTIRKQLRAIYLENIQRLARRKILF